MVNDRSEVSIDGDLIRDRSDLSLAQEKLFEMTNGGICCTLREDRSVEVRRLAAEGRFNDHSAAQSGTTLPAPRCQAAPGLKLPSGAQTSRMTSRQNAQP